MSDHPLKQIGEFGLIGRIQSWFNEETSDLLGIGDDCTVIPRGDDECDLVTTDLLIEGTHFLFDKITPEDLGHKSLAVNLSDIAAMGGQPKHVWLAIGLTDRADLPWLERFFNGMNKLARKHHVRLMGGDTTRSQKHLVINIMVSGTAAASQVKFRSSARPGDVLFVTGTLGNSGGGLQLLLGNHHNTEDPAERNLIRAHNRPDPAVNAGLWLGIQPGVHALIDLSDGISSDAGHVANRSGVTIALELTDLPIGADLRKVALKHGWDPVQLACSAGEDYVLFGSCDPDAWESLRVSYRKEIGAELHRVGDVRDRPETDAGGDPSESKPGLLSGGQVSYLKNGTPIDFNKHGFDHFKS